MVRLINLKEWENEKKNQTLTQLTLATTLVVAPTLAPLTIHAEETNLPIVKEQESVAWSGPTKENETMLKESKKKASEKMMTVQT